MGESSGGARGRRGPASRIAADESLRIRAVNRWIGFPVEPSEEELAALDAVVQKSSDAFLEEVNRAIDHLFEVLQAAETEGADIRAVLQTARYESYLIKSLGGTFGFPLISAIAKSLERFATALQSLDARQVDLSQLHVSAIRRILVDDIRGGGGSIEQEIVATFFAACEHLGAVDIPAETRERITGSGEPTDRREAQSPITPTRRKPLGIDWE